ncbi:MAG: helix-turn-helix domain-containing protein [Bacteroidota bacterium]
MDSEIDIGGMVRYHRKRADLTRIQLAALAGVGKTVVFDIEANKQSVKCSTLRNVLQALNIRILFEGPLMEEYRKQQNAKR